MDTAEIVGADDQQGGDGAAKGAKSDKVIKACRDLIKYVVDTDGENRNEAIDDLEFLSGDQWPEDIQRERGLDGRPCLTINTLPTYLHQVTNDIRQNKGAIKTHAVDDGADEETAETIQGLIRHIEYDSNADVAYVTAGSGAASNGFGWFRLVTEYCDETSFEQDIKFRRIRNPLTVYPGYHEQPDGSDLKQLAISVKMPRKDFEREYPGADMAGFKDLDADWTDWCDDQFIRIAEYYRIEYEDADVVLLSNGESGFKDKLLGLPEGVTIVKTRKGQRAKVMWSKLTAVEELESAEIKSKWIPVFPVYGDELDIEGRVIRSGLIRHSKDPVRMHNFWMTCATEEVSLRPKTPFIGAEGQFEGNEDTWGQMNQRSFAYAEYKPISIDGTLAPPPQRQQMADIPSGMLAMVTVSKQNIKDTLGMFNAAVGERGSATSGKQELAQQREADVGTFHYTDNLNLARKHAGRCIISMLPHYYDTERTVRILGEDGSVGTATINEPNRAQKPSKDKEVRAVLNNLTAGKYDVTVTSGPSYTTARTEAADYLTQVAQGTKDPATSSVVTYLAIKSSDMPGAKEAVKMLEKLPTIAPLLPQDEGEEEVIQTPKGPLPISQVPQAIATMDQAMTQMEVALQKADAQGKDNQARELAIKETEANTKAQQADTAHLEAQRAVMDEAFEARIREQKLIEEAEDAKDETERTKIIADLKMTVNDAVHKLEGMKQEAVEAQAEADGAVTAEAESRAAQQNAQSEQKNDAITVMQQDLIAQLTQAVAMLSAPRKVTLIKGDDGRPTGAVSSLQ